MCTCVRTVGEEDIAVNRGIGKGEREEEGEVLGNITRMSKQLSVTWLKKKVYTSVLTHKVAYNPTVFAQAVESVAVIFLSIYIEAADSP